MLAGGATKEEVFARTGQIVGVHNVSFEVKEGEIFVLMGLSGSGKSTLIRLINRLVEPTAGKVLIDGRDVAAVPRSELTSLRRKDMSMVFQSFALMPQRTVLSNAAFGLEVAGVGPQGAREARDDRARTGRPRAVRAEAAGATIGRHAAARGPRARAGGQSVADDHGRGVLRARSAQAQGNAERAARSATRAAAHDPVRVARSGRGDAHRHAHRDHGRRPRGADRHAAGNHHESRRRLRARVLRRHRHEPLSDRRRPDADRRRAAHAALAADRRIERRGDAQRQRRLRVRAGRERRIRGFVGRDAIGNASPQSIRSNASSAARRSTMS